MATVLSKALARIAPGVGYVGRGRLMVPKVLEPASLVGKYEIVAHLATGGMGVVYKAIDRDLGRVVALKVMHSELSSDNIVMERFRREARHAARLNHPNIVTLYECSFDPKHQVNYLTLEFINGIDLANYIDQRGCLRPEEVRRILIQAAKALEHAFEHGIVHRDIKPSNIMLARAHKKIVVKVTDLGLAIAKSDDEYRVTREGSTVGTIDYMSPEQARDSRSADIRSDIYSLGCTAYHLLAGKAPFAEGGLGERLIKHLETPPPDVRKSNPAVTGEFWAILQRMLAKDPDERFPTPNELIRELKAIRAEESAGAAGGSVGSSAHGTKNVADEPTRVSIPTPAEEPPPTTELQIDEEEADAPAPKPKKPTAPPVSVEQARAAAAFFERAVQVLQEGGGDDYARQLLDNSLKLDPFNLAYRRKLRELNAGASRGMLGRWFGSLNVLAIKSKMRMARSNRDLRKVFELGEQVLAHAPADADTHIEMAETALELGVPTLAIWLLEQGRDQAPGDVNLLRAQAGAHEMMKQWKLAIALWERVAKLDPADADAQRKINNLSAMDLMTSGHYKK